MDVDTGRMNAGIPLGDTADLAVACWETRTQRRATRRDMFAAAESSALWSQAHIIRGSLTRSVRRDGSGCGEFALVLPPADAGCVLGDPVEIHTITDVGQSGVGSLAFYCPDNVQRASYIVALLQEKWSWLGVDWYGMLC